MPNLPERGVMLIRLVALAGAALCLVNAVSVVAPFAVFLSNGSIMSASAAETNRIVAIRRALAEGRAIIEIELQSSRAFPVGGALATLTIGDKSFQLSRFPSGKTDRLVFMLDPAEFAALPDGAPVSVAIGGAPPWRFGALAKP